MITRFRLEYKSIISRGVGADVSHFYCAAADTPLPEIKTIHLPEGAIAPDAILDRQGTLHVVYGQGDSAWYIKSDDNGTVFTFPVKINSEGAVQTAMGERGPKLALGKDNSIHVVWADKWHPGAKIMARYSCSTDQGKTFEPARVVSGRTGIDGLTLTADSEGGVAMFYHVGGIPPQKNISAYSTIFMARSTDGGKVFAPEENIQISGLSGLACSMCMMRARFAADGSLCLAFRSAENNIRDFYLLKSSKQTTVFQPLRVNNDNWELRNCPMCGPELAFDSKGRALCAFMSRNYVYWSALDQQGFQLHVPTPSHEKEEIYPSVCGNNTHVLMVWQVGLMSTSGRATVKWALYTVDGQFTGKQGVIGDSSSGTKATAYAGTDGNFYILTTAK